MGGDRGVLVGHPPIESLVKASYRATYGVIRVLSSGLWGDKALIKGGGGGLYT